MAQDVFNQEREQLKQRIASQGQQQNEALQRKFAAMGGGPGSGAAIKIQQQGDEALGRQQEEAMTGIAAKEAQFQEGDKQRQFQSGEAEKARTFEGDKFNKQLDFQKGQAAFENSTKLRDLDRLDKQFAAQMEQAKFDQEQDSNFFSGRNLGKMAGGLAGIATGGFVSKLLK